MLLPYYPNYELLKAILYLNLHSRIWRKHQWQMHRQRYVLLQESRAYFSIICLENKVLFLKDPQKLMVNLISIVNNKCSVW